MGFSQNRVIKQNTRSDIHQEKEKKKNEQRRAQTKEERRNALCEELGRGC